MASTPPAGGFNRFASKAPTGPAPAAAAPTPPAPAPAVAGPVKLGAARAPVPMPAAGNRFPAPPAKAPTPPAPAERQVEATVVATAAAEPEVHAPAPKAVNHALTTLGPLKASALALIAAEPDSTFMETFPTIRLKGGNAGGNVIPTDATSKNWPEVANALPQGKQPFKGILMGARSQAIAWPCDFDSKQEGDRPCLTAAIPLTDGDSTALLLTGCENFQFAPRDKKAEKWTAANGGPGYLRPVFQLLVWHPVLGEPVVVESCGLLATYRKMAGQVGQFIDAETGELKPVPCVFQPTTEPWYDANVFHYFAGSWWINDAEAQTAWDNFGAWVQDVQANRPDVVQGIMEWCMGLDLPVDEGVTAKLRQAANLVNPRGRRKPASPTA